MFRAHLHPVTATCLRHDCNVARNGLQSHFQVADKFDASVDADTWCNSTAQNPYILIWEQSRSGVANAAGPYGCPFKVTVN